MACYYSLIPRLYSMWQKAGEEPGNKASYVACMTGFSD